MSSFSEYLFPVFCDLKLKIKPNLSCIIPKSSGMLLQFVFIERDL